MSKKLKLLTIITILILCVLVFGACEFKYEGKDSLSIANMSFGEKIWIGLQVAFLGIAMVFIVLAFLIGFIILIKYLFIIINNMKGKKVKNQTENSQNKNIEINNLEEEIVAAVMAAIQVYYESQIEIESKSNLKFKVRSIKEIK